MASGVFERRAVPIGATAVGAIHLVRSLAFDLTLGSILFAVDRSDRR